METFEVFTIGNAYFLDKMFNAIRIIFASGLTGILKVTVSLSLALLVIKACLSSNFKDISKWMVGVIILTSFFLNTRAKLVIHDSLPDSIGRIQAPYIVEDVPWGLAWIAYASSNIGKVMMNKFESAFASVTNNQTYRKYGVLFGSKIIEDANKIRISNADLRGHMVKFYRQCIVPDLKMGHTRKNGYTFQELALTQDIGEFLKDHASQARSIYLNASIVTKEKTGGFFGSTESKTTIDGYISCNKAAHFISDMIEQEIKANKHLISSSFISQFMGDNIPLETKNHFFESMLTDTYSAFLKSSRDASEILKQNIMINAITDSAKSVSSSYSKIATDEMTRSSMYSVSQVFQKFIPIIRSVFECLFYGVAPLVLILMVTPIGFEVLKNYAFSFIYLQIWPPMYAILYVITESWTRFSSSGFKHNMECLPQIEAINYDIAMVSGYMLALIPVLSMFITKGLVASAGNMATSMMYIPQTAAVNTSDQAIKGNFSIGNTSLDTHSYDTLNAHKFDDNYSWMSGMRSFQQHTGSIIRETPQGAQIMDLSGSSHNLAGRLSLGMDQAIGSSLNESERRAQTEIDAASKEYVESESAVLSKLIGYDKSFVRGTGAYDAINKSMTHEQRESTDYVRGTVDRIAKNTGMTSNDVLKVTASLKGGVGPASLEITSATESQKTQAWNETQEAMKEEKFTKSLGIVESAARTNNIQTTENESESAINSLKSDSSRAFSASARVNQAKESLHSIQQERSNYESNSQSIRVDLTNNAVNWGIKKFGEEELEKRLNDNSYELAKQFLEENPIKKTKHTFSPLQSNSLKLTESDRSSIYGEHNKNNAVLNNESEDFIEKSENNITNLKGKHIDATRDFIKSNDDKKQISADASDKIEKKAEAIETAGKEKVNKSLLEHAFSRIPDNY